MSEHPREAQRHLKKIHVADDGWFDVFALFGRVKLGLTLALISDRFDRLVDAHLGRMKWQISGQLSICRATIYGTGVLKINQQFDKSKHRCTAVKLPLPQSPPLKGIIGFNKITIGYIDRALKIRPAEQRSWHILTHEIWPFVSNKLYKIAGSKDNFVLLRLRQHFGATVLRDSAGGYSSLGQALAEWLHTPREDGRPKLLLCGTWCKPTTWKLDDFKKAFTIATTPVNFIVRLPLACFNGAPFMLVNEQMRERLSMRKCNGGWLLKRLPFGLDAKQWMEWHREAIFYHDINNHLVVSFDDQNIDCWTDHFPAPE
uniref:Uncharacterized protein n=1 Tax=Globodera rostochiensis TaxID=31243 RepID=A0A914IFA7_GLORO